MNPFIYPYQLNCVRNELGKLLNVVYFAGDYRVYQAAKDSLEASIISLFGFLTSEQASLFQGMAEIKNQRSLNAFLDTLRPYVIPFPFDARQIRHLFKKEKKLTIPDPAHFDLSTMSYFGWRDPGTRHLYLVYPYKEELVGVRCRYTVGNASKPGVCCLCNAAFKGDDVGLVVANIKSAVYQSIGNYMCLNSVTCNQHMTSVTGLEGFLQKIFRR